MRGSGERRDNHDHRVEHQQPPAATARPHVQMVRVMVMVTVVSVHSAMVMLMDVGNRKRRFRSPTIAEPLLFAVVQPPPLVFG